MVSDNDAILILSWQNDIMTILRFSVEYMRFLNASKVSIEGFDPKKIDDPDYCDFILVPRQAGGSAGNREHMAAQGSQFFIQIVCKTSFVFILAQNKRNCNSFEYF